MQGTLIIMIYGILPDSGILRTEQPVQRFAATTGAILTLNHLLDPAPLYFLSALVKGPAQYESYKTLLDKDKFNNLTVAYSRSPKTTLTSTSLHAGHAHHDATWALSSPENPEGGADTRLQLVSFLR